MIIHENELLNNNYYNINEDLILEQADILIENMGLDKIEDRLEYNFWYNEFNNYFSNYPISENSDYLYYLLEELTPKANEKMNKQTEENDKKSTINIDEIYKTNRKLKNYKIANALMPTVGVAITSAIIYPNEYKESMNRLKRLAERKPKSWIGQKIKALRNLYGRWLDKAKAERDTRKAGVFKSIAVTIANCIDYLLKKLQNFAG